MICPSNRPIPVGTMTTDVEPDLRIAVRTLNDLITCVLCGGYYVDATTVVDCLHTFCKTCIVRYLETSNYCPVCDIQLHETNPLLNLRRDHTLQDLVYKLVPGMLSREIKRRREFTELKQDQGDSGIGLSEESMLVEENTDGRFYREDEHISVLLEFSPDAKLPRQKRHRRRQHRRHRSRHGNQVNNNNNNNDDDDDDEDDVDDRRLNRLRQHSYLSCSAGAASDYNKTSRRHYLLCPAPVTVSHLKKFISLKYRLEPHLKIVVFHTDEALKDSYTLMDIAYIYTWRRSRPLRLYYSIYDGPEILPPPIDFGRRRRRAAVADTSLTSNPASRDDITDPPDVKPVIGVDVRPPPAALLSPTSGATSRLSLTTGSGAGSRRLRSRRQDRNDRGSPSRRNGVSRAVRRRRSSSADASAADGSCDPQAKRIKQESCMSEELYGNARISTEPTSSSNASSSGYGTAGFRCFQRPSSPPSLPASLRFSPLIFSAPPAAASPRQTQSFLPPAPPHPSPSWPLVSPPIQPHVHAPPPPPKLSLPVTISKNFIKELVVSRSLEKYLAETSAAATAEDRSQKTNIDLRRT